MRAERSPPALRSQTRAARRSHGNLLSPASQATPVPLTSIQAHLGRLDRWCWRCADRARARSAAQATSRMLCWTQSKVGRLRQRPYGDERSGRDSRPARNDGGHRNEPHVATGGAEAQRQRPPRDGELQRHDREARDRRNNCLAPEILEAHGCSGCGAHPHRAGRASWASSGVAVRPVPKRAAGNRQRHGCRTGRARGGARVRERPYREEFRRRDSRANPRGAANYRLTESGRRAPAGLCRRLPF